VLHNEKNLKVIPENSQGLFAPRKLFLSNFAIAQMKSKRQPHIIDILRISIMSNSTHF